MTAVVSNAAANAGTTPLPLAIGTRAFEAEHVTGTMALFDTQTGKVACSDAIRCRTSYPPSATFEIVTALVALENGALNDAESPLRSDGQGHENTTWNHDHTLRSALSVSCRPCFANLARQLGEAPLRTGLLRLTYGNRDTRGPVETWGTSEGLRVSPLEQLDFLRRLDTGAFELKPRTLDVIREVLTLDVGPDHVLRGKTALIGPPDQATEVGWFIGYLELGERRIFFATVVDGHSGDVEMNLVPRRLTERALRELQLLP